MDFIIDAIVEWLKGLLVDGIMGNLDGLFDNVNQSVGEIATQVGTTPADWNAGVFSMIRQISETAILPIAGVILTFVMTYELIQMLIERNNLHEVDTWMFFKWVFKTFVAVMILTNTFNIVLAVFDVSQHVIQQSAGIIQNGTEITPDMLDSLRTELEAMELGPLFGLWLQSFLIQLTMIALNIVIFVIVYIHVKKGRIYGLLGRNGAGKTTTMRMLLGLTAPTSGEVTIFGKPFQGNEKNILPRIGCLIESPGFYPNLTGTENLKIFAELRGLRSPKYIKNALELVNLPYRDKKLFSQYSLGMKQRLAIALAVMHNPELLILDEPINGLDPIGIAEVRDFIRELCDTSGKTILISSHILSEISLLADDVGIIDHGKLLEEESLKELEAKNAKFIHFCVSDAQKAAKIIAATFHSKDFRLTDANNLYLYDMTLPVERINRSFVESGIEIQEVHLCEDTLEDYFKKITGGEGIA